MADLSDLPPLQRLLVFAAPRADRPWQHLCWALDQRLADVVRTTSDPMIGAIRMAWWEEALVEDDRGKGGGEPLVEAWRAAAPPARARDAAAALIEGWRALLGQEEIGREALSAFAAGRGEGLFRLLGGEGGEGGALWALWDLAGHVRDASLAGAAMALAGEQPVGLARGRRLKPLRLAAKVALADVRAGRVPEGGFAPRHYRRLLWLGLFG